MYLLLEHPVHVRDEFPHLVGGDDAVAVDVEDPEYLDEDLLGAAVRHDVVHHHELGEVHHAVIVLVIHPQPDMEAMFGDVVQDKRKTNVNEDFSRRVSQFQLERICLV